MIFHGTPRRIFLKPGNLYLGEKPALISTLLGSCVAVTMFSPRLKSGGISHGLLPGCREKSCAGGDFCPEGVRYVDCSIRRMFDWFRQRGAARGEIEVKVFGGSDMFGAKDETARTSVGRQNIARAFQVLDEEHLRIAASDVGGEAGRKILFFTHTGEVLLKHLRRTEDRHEKCNEG